MSGRVGVGQQTNAQMQASANNILEAHNIFEPPINIYQILHDEQIPVDFMPFSSEVQGIYLKNVTGVGIAINQNNHAVKQRFTGAHELKHHYHDVTEHGKMLCSTNFHKRVIEQRANRFAAELLVPVHLFRQAIEELERTELWTITTLARAFHVSYETIVFRLHTLGYISSSRRDKLRTPSERQDDAHIALAQREQKNLAQLRSPALFTAFGISDGFWCCSCCGKLIFEPTWSVCHSCGKAFNGA